MISKEFALVATAVFSSAGCVQVGPKNEPLHIILDVNIKVQVEKDVESLWDSVEEQAKLNEIAAAAASTEKMP